MMILHNFGFLDFGPFSVVITLVLLVVLAFEIAMLVHVIRNNALTDNTKILWVAGMLLVHPVVAIVYYFTDYNKA